MPGFQGNTLQRTRSESAASLPMIHSHSPNWCPSSTAGRGGPAGVEREPAVHPSGDGAEAGSLSESVASRRWEGIAPRLATQQAPSADRCPLLRSPKQNINIPQRAQRTGAQEVQEKVEGALFPRKGTGNDRYRCRRRQSRTQRLTAKEQEPAVTERREILMRYNDSAQCERLSTGTDCPGRLRYPHPRKPSKLDWVIWSDFDVSLPLS